MKKIIISIVVILLLGLSSCSLTFQSNKEGDKSSVNDSDLLFKDTQQNVEQYIADYQSAIYDDEIQSRTSPFMNHSLEGGEVTEYFIGDQILRYEATLYDETQKRVVNVFCIKEDFLISELDETYDIPMIAETKSVLYYSLNKYFLKNGVLYSYDELNEVMKVSMDNMTEYSDLLTEIQKCFN
jgi:hypothetical protein